MQEPKKQTFGAFVRLFLAGALIIVPVAVAGIGVTGLMGADASPLARNFTVAVLGSSLPEEIARFAVLYLIAFPYLRPGRPRDGLVFGAVVSLGFSVAENLLYGLTLGWQMALLKLAIATPIHLALGVTMGALLVIARGRGPLRRGVGLVSALLLPALLHGAYDLVMLGALGASGPGTSQALRVILPATCYAIVIAYAAIIGRRACRQHAAAPGAA